ncbi:MAG: DUF4339 domain-containing protein [Blastochloris sp.]|nr:DUF4339 domain-containing protein [Blastochloris sp.]
MQWFYYDGESNCGPVETPALTNLLVRGKINGETLVWREGMADWQPLAETEIISSLQWEEPAAATETAPAIETLPEPASLAASVTTKSLADDMRSELPPSPVAGQLSEDVIQTLRGSYLSGAYWFYWIAGLSVVNIILHSVQSNVSLALGLATTDLLYYFGESMAEDPSLGYVRGIVLGINVLLIVLTAACGWLASMGHRYLYLFGLILVAFDSLLFIFPFFSFIAIAVHGYALFAMGTGLLALWKIREAESKLSSSLVPEVS